MSKDVGGYILRIIITAVSMCNNTLVGRTTQILTYPHLPSYNKDVKIWIISLQEVKKVIWKFMFNNKNFWFLKIRFSKVKFYMLKLL